MKIGCLRKERQISPLLNLIKNLMYRRLLFQEERKLTCKFKYKQKQILLAVQVISPKNTALAEDTQLPDIY